MMVIIGVKENLDEPRVVPALDAFSHDTGVQGVRVNHAHPHLMLVDYDEHQLRWPDIIDRMDQKGLHGRVCGN